MIDKNIAGVMEKRLTKYKNRYSYKDSVVMKSILSSYAFNKTGIMYKLKIFCDFQVIPDEFKDSAQKIYKEFSSI